MTGVARLDRAARDAVAPTVTTSTAAGVLSFRRWLALSAAGFVAFFAVWWLMAVSGLVSPQFLPTPLEVLEKFIDLTQSPFVGYTLQQHLWSSFGRFAMGFGLAVAIGIPLGLLMGWFRWLDAIVTPLFDALRFVAPIAWVPFAALWFGTGIGGPVLIIFSGAFPPCVINAYRGAKYVETRFIEAAQTLGASQLADDHRGAAAGIRAVDRRGAADQRRPRLAVAGRRRADRRVERDRLPAGQGPVATSARRS